MTQHVDYREDQENLMQPSKDVNLKELARAIAYEERLLAHCNYFGACHEEYSFV